MPMRRMGTSISRMHHTCLQRIVIPQSTFVVTNPFHDVKHILLSPAKRGAPSKELCNKKEDSDTPIQNKETSDQPHN